ncbi:MAG: hypothetical protein PHS82_03060 [Lachnospiraceae bacterium]|nr:hypothetical protein [Lachnospiraceae bacterium]
MNIDGEDYLSENMQGNPVLTKPLLEKPAIGRVCSATMSVAIKPMAGITIPKAARVYAYCRLVTKDGKTATQWLPQGAFYISSRSGKTNISLSLRDDMVKAGQTYYDKSSITNWPATQQLVLDDICRIMGVEADTRTKINNQASYRVNYISDDTLISEVLSFIAASNGGNWIMTESGKLRLVPLASPGTPVATLGSKHGGYTDNGMETVISRITMTDSNDTIFTAGDDSGYELTCDNPFADQQVVNNLITKLKGVIYRPYAVKKAWLNPLMELGDTISITKKDGSNVNVILNEIIVSCNAGYTCSLETGAEQDCEDEFPFKTSSELKEGRSVRTDRVYYGTSLTRLNGLVISRIKNDLEEAKVTFNADTMAFYQNGEAVLYFDAAARTWKMSASMEIEVKGDEGASTTLSLLADSLNASVKSLTKGYLEVKGTADGLTSTVKTLDDNYVTISQTIDGFTIKNAQGETLIDGASIHTDNLFLSRLFSKTGNDSYIEMQDNGLNFILGRKESIGIGYYSSDVPMPYMTFGAGSNPDTSNAGMVKKYPNGIWIGDTADRYNSEIIDGTGIFINTNTQIIYKYNKGTGVALADTSNVTAVFG